MAPPGPRARLGAPASVPALSIVACSRNDDHGGHLLERMQLFIDGIADQAARFALHCELVLVEWNPPPGRPGLADALRYPDGGGHLSSRVITVPPEQHRLRPHSDAMPMFEMMAKNVGIRRAAGRIILSTNVDVLFPDALFAMLARRCFDERALFRADRADISVRYGQPEALDPGALRARRPDRVHRRDGLHSPDGDRLEPIYLGLFDLAGQAARRLLSPGRYAPIRPARSASPPASRCRPAEVARKLRRLATMPIPHVNAAGDFTMMSRASWLSVGGYVEWPVRNWNLDALLIYQARACGIREVDLDDRYTVVHMDHGRGAQRTDRRAIEPVAERGANRVPVVSDAMLADHARSLGLSRFARRAPRRPAPGWGLEGVDLPEREPPADAQLPPAAERSSARPAPCWAPESPPAALERQQPPARARATCSITPSR